METLLHLIDEQVLAVAPGSNCDFISKLIFIVYEMILDFKFLEMFVCRNLLPYILSQLHFCIFWPVIETDKRC